MKKLVLTATSVVVALATLSSAAYAEQMTSIETGKPFVMKGIDTKPNTYVINQDWADINHDGIADHIVLIGTKEDPKDAYVENLNLVVQDGKTERILQSKISEYAGYDPYISFVGDFNGDHKEDIMVTADTGGSGGYVSNRIVSFAGDAPKVIFEDMTQEQVFNHLEPVDQNGDGVYELISTTRITGESNAETLGYEQSTLAFDKEKGKFRVTQTNKKSSMNEAINSYHSKKGGYTFIVPRDWKDSVQMVERNAEQLKDISGGKSATYMMYKPKHKDASGDQSPQFLAGITVYDKAFWEQHKDEPNMGGVLAQENNLVVTFNGPQSNPFEPGGEDFAIYNELFKHIKSLKYSFFMTPEEWKDNQDAQQPTVNKLQLKTLTNVYDGINGKVLFAASPQNVTVIGKKKDKNNVEWVEIVSWLGNAWIKAPQTK